MSWIIAQFWPYIAGGAAFIVALIAAYTKGGQRTADRIKAKEAKDREKVIDRLASGAAAKPTGSVHDDPHNRDTWKR